MNQIQGVIHPNEQTQPMRHKSQSKQYIELQNKLDTMAQQASPCSADDYNRYQWRAIPQGQREAMKTLHKETHGIYHESTYYFATTHGKEHQLRHLSTSIIRYNQIYLMNNDELTDEQVTEGFDGLMKDQQHWNDPQAGQSIRVSMIQWNHEQAKFVTTTKEVTLGNCNECFSLSPLGMNCKYCPGRSMMLHFTNSNTALHCYSLGAAPRWFIELYPRCNPIRLAKLLNRGTKPFFDELHYEEQGTYPSYDEVGNDLWNPIHIEKPIQAYINSADQDENHTQIEDKLHWATNCHYIEIYDCFVRFRDQFDPVLWDGIMRQRARNETLPNLETDADLFWNMTREEMDEEADSRFQEQFEAEQEAQNEQQE